MSDHLIPVHDLALAGQYKLYREAPFGDVFVCRVRHRGRKPAGSVRAGEGECLVAFSRRCTHLGCHLAPDVADGSVGQLPTLPGEQRFSAVTLCPCHFSSFDLAGQGLVVLGPATACLPQVELKRQGAGQVRLVRWMRDRPRGVPYGVPFGGTDKEPPEKPQE